MDVRIYKLWRSLIEEQLSPRSVRALEVYESAEELYSDRVSAAMLLPLREGELLRAAALDRAAAVTECCLRSGIELVFPDDAAFPKQLLSLYDVPKRLFFMGSLGCLDGRTCGIVGAREADDYSYRLTRKLSADIAARGITVCSGFALGIDRAAHFGALDASGRTAAVLGCGLMYDYPRGSAKLKETIAERGGVIMSEYLPDELPLAENFLRRNRITAAVSDCVLCTQAAQRSGTLSTVKYALELSRPVFVTPPHDLLSGRYAGIVSLLRDGAEQIYSADDLIESCFPELTPE